MTAQTRSGFTVLTFGDRSAPRSLAELPALRVGEAADIDGAAADARRLLVVGSDADLAAVLSRLMRQDALDVEVAQVRGRLSARRALSGTARRVPLIRDDTGTALVGAAQWLPPSGAAAIRGEATIPGKDIQLRMTIRRNADKTLPASHIIELIFLTPENFEGGGIENILRFALKNTEEAAAASASLRRASSGSWPGGA